MLTAQKLTNLFRTEFREVTDNFKARCPFHNERTPSFYVHKEEYVAHCFGCDISGYIDELASLFSGISVDEARTALDVSVAERVTRRLELGKQEKQEPVFIPESWLAPYKRKAHQYVITRGFSVEVLAAAGSCYDADKARQVFPHRDRGGRLVGAVGRACKEQQPKWLFYWGYDKGRTLYAPFELKPLRPTILVEGVFDLLWIYQNGFGSKYNLAAPTGATATRQQLSEAISECGELILGFDNDEAGQAGNWRAHYQTRRDVRTSFLSWPEGTNDWMDLDRDGIERILQERRTPLVHRLRTTSREKK